jgi:hypothetical protein
MQTLIKAVALTALATSLLVSPAMAANDPVRLSFDKALVDPAGVWEGTVSGDIDGDLTTELLSLEVTGAIWHVTFDWIVTADDQSFVATMDGILNTKTGGVVMNGTITSGWLLGARVHEEGQLIDPDPATLRFIGEITILPATP